MSDARVDLSEIDHHRAEHLIRAFDIMAERTKANMDTALWAVAVLTCKIMAAAASAGVHDEQGERLAQMVRIAYPSVVRAMEQAKRQIDGRRPYDA